MGLSRTPKITRKECLFASYALGRKCTKGKPKMQTRNEFLSDKKVTRKGKVKERPWRWKKCLVQLLFESFMRMGEKGKAERCMDCGSWLEFTGTAMELGKLTNANFCKLRLCPMCSWRRSEKIFGQVSKVMDYMEEHHKYRYLFLTLTVKNIVGNDLSKAIDELMKAWQKMWDKEKDFKAICKGFFRALEVTYNFERKDFHPHIHVIIAVDKRYFDKLDKQSGYMNHDAWMKLWRKCANLEYDPWVDIRTVKSDVEKRSKGEISYAGAVAEVAKYTVKGENYILDPYRIAKNTGMPTEGKNYEELKIYLQEYTDELVKILDNALRGRRLVSFGGIMRRVHKHLNLDNPEEGDLIRAEKTEIRDDLNYVIRTYRWNVEYMNHVLVAVDDGQESKEK